MAHWEGHVGFDQAEGSTANPASRNHGDGCADECGPTDVDNIVASQTWEDAAEPAPDATA